MNSVPAALRMPRRIVNQLLDHARQSPETEICGFIAAQGETPVRCIRIANIATSPSCRYAMDPQQQIAALRSMRERGEELYAIYHSHPHSPAAPSVIDVKEAGYPDACYLIISLDTKGVLEMRGFRINADQVDELPLELA
jgi:proteasome lid subunit RPN8/RPN11